MTIFLRLLAACLLPGSFTVPQVQAAEAVSSDFRCLTETGTGQIQLEFRIFSDSGSDWSGGYVRYKGSKGVVTVVPGRTETLDKPDGRPWQFRTTWLEIVDGKVAGEYIYGFDYGNLRTGKRYGFAQDVAATGDNACAWK